MSITSATPHRGTSASPDAGLTMTVAATSEAEEVLAMLGTSASGLSMVEARNRLASYGPNVLHEHKVTAIEVLLRQLRNPLLILLLGAAGVSGLTGDPTDAVIIGVIVVLSVGLSFFNEFRSEQAVAELHSRVHHETVVRRDGAPVRIDVRNVVPGDLVVLQVGDVVPADLRLLKTQQLECDEGVLTGESMPTEKSSAAISSPDSPVDLPSCAFMGTIVHQGGGEGVVVATAAGTAFGKIVVGLGGPATYTAFQAGLKDFSKLLVWVAAVLSVSIFVINVIYARPVIDALLFSLAIAIGINRSFSPPSSASVWQPDRENWHGVRFW